MSPRLTGVSERSGDLGLLAWSESHKPNPASIGVLGVRSYRRVGIADLGSRVTPKGRYRDPSGGTRMDEVRSRVFKRKGR